MLMVFILANALTFGSPYQEKLCFAFAELSVATIEAHQAGVPLRKILETIDQGINGGHEPSSLREILREGALKQYSNPPSSGKIDRQRLTDQFAAECLLTELKQ